MLPAELKQMIYRKEVPNFLIFIDNDPYQAFVYKAQIARLVGQPVNYYPTLEEAVYDASMVLSDDCMYVVQMDGSKGLNEKHQALLQALKDAGKYSIVMLENYNEKKSPLNAFKNNVVIFNKQDTKHLFEYAVKVCASNNVVIPQEELLALIEKSNNDFGVVINTLEQLCTLSKMGKDISFYNFADYREGNLFELIDMIIARNENAWQYSTLVKDSPSVIAFNLYRKAREKTKTTNSAYYMKLMELCERIFNGINDGSIKESWALKYLIYNAFL